MNDKQDVKLYIEIIPTIGNRAFSSNVDKKLSPKLDLVFGTGYYIQAQYYLFPVKYS